MTLTDVSGEGHRSQNMIKQSYLAQSHPTDIISGTKVQYHDVRSRSNLKVTNVEVSAFRENATCYYFFVTYFIQIEFVIFQRFHF